MEAKQAAGGDSQHLEAARGALLSARSFLRGEGQGIHPTQTTAAVFVLYLSLNFKLNIF